MANSKSFRENLSELQALYNKLENGQLSRDEVQDLTYNARELYERSLIIQYKIFEGSTVDIQAIDQQVEEIEESSSGETSDDKPFDLSLFDESSSSETSEVEPIEELQEEVIEEMTASQEVEEIIEETTEEIEELADEMMIEETPSHSVASHPIVEELVEEVIETPQVAEPVIEEIKAEPIFESVVPEPIIEKSEPISIPSGSGLLDKLRSLIDPSESQFGMGSVTSLVGSFGLNERLLYINELFGGSSEAFANAIQNLDTAGDFNTALEKVGAYAAQNNWNTNSETVSDFVNKIKRRYA